MNNQMGLLRERWRCPTLGGKCGSEHCFVQPDSADHFILGFRELESWAAAIVSTFLLTFVSLLCNFALTAQRSSVCNNRHTPEQQSIQCT
jgi:hypothetical protein